MPYRRYQKRYNRVPTNKQLDKKIKKIQGDLETKYKDTAYTVGQVEADAFTVYPIGLVGNSADARGRIADWVRGTSLKMRINVTFIPNTIEASTMLLRMIVFYDRSCNGVTPSVINTDFSVLDSSSSPLPHLQQYNFSAMQQRYHILYDKTHTIISPAGTSAGGGAATYPSSVTRFIKKTIKLSRKTIYSGDEAVVADVESNGLFVAWYSIIPESEESDPNQLQLYGSIRMYYKDA